MSTAPPPLSLILIVSVLLLSPSLSHSLPFSNYHTLLSLSHSLASRVATLRASRGDIEGSARARNLARSLERGLGWGFFKLAWNVGWDYMKNYAWRGTTSFRDMGVVVYDMNELIRALGEFARVESDSERVAWVSRNYKNVLRLSKSIFSQLLRFFRQSGPLRDVVESLQKEIVDGDLLRDCLEVGAGDLQGLFQVFKDIAVQYASSSSKTEL